VPENFDAPYLKRNIAAFWRSWHMSLTSWITDYVYIPLGGNRRGIARRDANLMTTMGLGGLWHGASLNFVGSNSPINAGESPSQTKSVRSTLAQTLRISF